MTHRARELRRRGRRNEGVADTKSLPNHPPQLPRTDYHTESRREHGKKKKRLIIRETNVTETLIGQAYPCEYDPLPKGECYTVKLNDTTTSLILATTFMTTVAQAFGGELAHWSQLHANNATSYAGGYSESGEIAKNFSGIETPWTISEAMEGPQKEEWAKALRKEVEMVTSRGTWIGPVPPAQYEGRQVIGSKIAFKVKYENGEVKKLKCRHVALGNNQTEGDSFDDTFAPVARIDTVRMMCANAARTNRKIKQLDFEGAYTQATLEGVDIYMRMPKAFYTYRDFIGLTPAMIGEEGDVFKLERSLYGLKQAGLLWYELLRDDIKDLGFTQSQADECLYTMRTDDGFEATMVVYVDDVLYYSNDEARMERLIDSWTSAEGKNRTIERMGVAKWFLGIKIDQTNDGMISLTQTDYVDALLKNNVLFPGMQDCNSVDTPCSTSPNIDKSSCPEGNLTSAERAQQSGYRSVVGAILYLNKSTRPDITFAINRLGRYTSNPGQAHFKELKHLLRYLRGTRELGLTFHRDHRPEFHIDTNSIREKEEFDLVRPVGFGDADWASDQSTRRSCSGWTITWMGASINYGCSVQQCIALSTTEAEVIALTRAVQEVVCMRKVYEDLVGVNEQPTFVFCDNNAAIQLTRNNRHHKRTKHIDLRFFYCRDKEKDGTIRSARVPTKLNIADSFTKVMDRFTVKRHRFQLHGMDLKGTGGGGIGKAVFHKVEDAQADVAQSSASRDGARRCSACGRILDHSDRPETGLCEVCASHRISRPGGEIRVNKEYHDDTREYIGHNRLDEANRSESQIVEIDISAQGSIHQSVRQHPSDLRR